MVVIHTVLFKYRRELSIEKLEEISKEFNRLICIPGVDNVQFGPTFTDRGKGYTHMLVVEVADRATLSEYSNHPDHLNFVAENVRPFVEHDDILAMDIEV